MGITQTKGLKPPPPAVGAPSPAPMTNVLVKDAKSLLGAMRRLHVANDAIMFWNTDETFKILLRNDPEGDISQDGMTWDLSIVWDDDDDDDDHLTRVMELEHDGFLEEPGTFVVDSGSIASMAAAFEDPDGNADLAKARETINRVHAYTICPCAKYLIKDEDQRTCVFCHLTASPEDMQHHFCAICQSDGTRRHMVQQACCKQYLHRTCLASWASKGPSSTTALACPLCRTL